MIEQNQQVASDMFEDDISLDFPVDVQTPKLAKVEEEKPAPPAFTVINKNSLTETEYAIYSIALEGVEDLNNKYGTLDERFTRDCSVLRLSLLDILARKFGYRDATAASADGLSFKLKANHEVELLKKGE